LPGGVAPSPLERDSRALQAFPSTPTSLIIPLPPIWQPSSIPPLRPSVSNSAVVTIDGMVANLPPSVPLSPDDVLPQTLPAFRDVALSGVPLSHTLTSLPFRDPVAQKQQQQRHLSSPSVPSSSPSNRRSSVPGHSVSYMAKPENAAFSSGQALPEQDEDLPDVLPSPSSRSLLKAQTFDEKRLEQLRAHALAESAKARLDQLVGTEAEWTRARAPQLVLGHHPSSGLSIGAAGVSVNGPGIVIGGPAAAIAAVGLPPALGAPPIVRPAAARRASMGPMSGPRGS
jgi:hypothetical protein